MPGQKRKVPSGGASSSSSSPSVPKDKGVCFAFQKGKCSRGDDCRFSHEAEGEKAKTEEAAPVKFDFPKALEATYGKDANLTQFVLVPKEESIGSEMVELTRPNTSIRISIRIRINIRIRIKINIRLATRGR